MSLILTSFQYYAHCSHQSLSVLINTWRIPAAINTEVIITEPILYYTFMFTWSHWKNTQHNPFTFILTVFCWESWIPVFISGLLVKTGDTTQKCNDKKKYSNHVFHHDQCNDSHFLQIIEQTYWKIGDWHPTDIWYWQVGPWGLSSIPWHDWDALSMPSSQEEPTLLRSADWPGWIKFVEFFFWSFSITIQSICLIL